MSCFVHVATRLVDLETIKQAAELLGYAVRQGERVAVAGWNDQTTEAELAVALGNGYDVGVVRGEGGCTLVADWSMAHQDATAFTNRLAQAYGQVRVHEQAKRQGYVITKEERQADGSVRLLLRRFA